jgi:hypothetical protein
VCCAFAGGSRSHHDRTHQRGGSTPSVNNQKRKQHCSRVQVSHHSICRAGCASAVPLRKEQVLHIVCRAGSMVQAGSNSVHVQIWVDGLLACWLCNLLCWCHVCLQGHYSRARYPPGPASNPQWRLCTPCGSADEGWGRQGAVSASSEGCVQLATASLAEQVKGDSN